jgi:ElaB/YqjD/DUF883 family membrane-anchored ribosome-binding protein
MPYKNELESSGTSVLPAATDLRKEAGELTGSIGRTMHSAAQTIRGAKKSTDTALDTIADGIDHSTDYLSEQGIAGVVKDLETLVRRHPLQTLLIGLSVGYLLTRSR